MKGYNVDSSNGLWKGDEAKSQAIHVYVRNRLPKPKVCPDCETLPPRDLANISPSYDPKTYTRDLSNWRWLCRRCHMVSDGRLENLKKVQERRSNKKFYINGHEFTEQNTYFFKYSRTGSTGRRCKTCQKQAYEKSKAKVKVSSSEESVNVQTQEQLDVMAELGVISNKILNMPLPRKVNRRAAIVQARKIAAIHLSELGYSSRQIAEALGLKSPNSITAYLADSSVKESNSVKELG